MPWGEGLVPQRMSRVAVVAPERRWHDVMAEVADAGVVELALPVGPAADAAVDTVASTAPARDGVRGVAGWAPAGALDELAGRLGPLGGSVVELPVPAGSDPPTLLAPAARGGGSRSLVDMYGVVPYRDVDPAWFAAAAYVVMFGMMFGDIGDGLLVALAGLYVWRSRDRRLARARAVWPLIVALGVSAMVFGALYGELFGPTIPPLWLRPLDQPTRLLAVAIGVGAGLLAVAYGIGIVNRWREGGMGVALYASSGIAGAALFVGCACVAAGVLAKWEWLWATGAVIAAAAMVLVAAGLRAGAGPGAAGALQASVELTDVVVRMGSNVVSFARLAAFGLTHAALGLVVWEATRSLWGAKPAVVAAIVVFVAGHAVAFALEALVAGVQALRLEYYELFSRVFVAEGRPFRPWHVPRPIVRLEEEPCSPG